MVDGGHMNKILLAVFLFLSLTLTGCNGGVARSTIEKEVKEQYKEELKKEALKEVESDKKGFQEYIEKKEKLNNIDVKPRDGESKLDALIRERQETKSEIEKTKQEITAKERLVEEGEGKVKALDTAIKQAEQDRLKFWANLVGGISAGVAIILFIASILTSGYPLLPTVMRYCALGFASLSALSFGFAAIIPYLTIIGVSLGIIVVGVSLFFWFKDRKSLGQVAEAIEKHKGEIKNYKDKFNMIIDTDVDRHLDKVREKVKKKLCDTTDNGKRIKNVHENLKKKPSK